jgi:hypothetical protein
MSVDGSAFIALRVATEIDPQHTRVFVLGPHDAKNDA